MTDLLAVITTAITQCDKSQRHKLMHLKIAHDKLLIGDYNLSLEQVVCVFEALVAAPLKNEKLKQLEQQLEYRLDLIHS